LKPLKIQMENNKESAEAPRKLTKKIETVAKEEKAYKITASPLADDRTIVKIFDMLEQANHYK
jgi:hypothetical protein